MLIAEIKRKFGAMQEIGKDDLSFNLASITKKLEGIGSSFKTSNTPTIIAQDLKIEGQINGQGIIEIEGVVNGDIFGGSVVIRERGFVEGKIFAESINLRGHFSGVIKAKIVSISSKADVKGQVEYQTLSVEDGASIEGEFKRVTDYKKTGS